MMHFQFTETNLIIEIVLLGLFITYMLVSGKWKRIYIKCKKDAKEESIENTSTIYLFLGGCFILFVGMAVFGGIIDNLEKDTYSSFGKTYKGLLFILVSIFVFFGIIKMVHKKDKVFSLKQIGEHLWCVDPLSKCVAISCLTIAGIILGASVSALEVPLFVPFMGGAFFIGGLMFLFQKHK